MKNIKMTVEELVDIVNNNSNVGMGSCGLVLEINDNYLFKFNYKTFIECFRQNGSQIELVIEDAERVHKEIKARKNVENFLYRNDTPPRIKNLKALMARQDKVFSTTFTQGFVYVEDYCVGYLLKNHKDMVNLFKYVKETSISESEQKNILSQIKNNMIELLDNAIYSSDFTMRNMLYNTETRKVEFIDFEDAVCCCESRDENKENQMLEQYENITKFFSKEKGMSL